MITVEFNASTRSYATRESALKAVDKFLEENQVTEKTPGSITVVIQAQHSRFSPVFLLRSEMMYLASRVAARGWYVFG